MVLTVDEQISYAQSTVTIETEERELSEEEAASLAAVIMDGHFPGWYKKIDLDNFTIADVDRCVLGYQEGGFIGGTSLFWQIYGGVHQAYERVPALYAFHGSNHSAPWDMPRLDAAWTKEILDRRKR